METELIFAGNYAQFRDYVAGRTDKKYIYVTQQSDILGRRNCKIIKIGTWYEKDNIERLIEFAEIYVKTIN